jgi:hypothetical protein
MLDEFMALLKEAHQSTEDSLALEDQGYVKLGTSTTGINILSDDERKQAVLKSRIYSVKDPLCKQAIRLWTDFTFGSGVTWSTKDEKAQEILSKFWFSQANAPILSPRGQRKISDKLLIDGEIFFAVFLGPESTIRTIDPLEITEIISNPDDIEEVRYYKREWFSPQGMPFKGYYKSFNNQSDEATLDKFGTLVKATESAVIHHFAYNTIGQRGNPLLLSVIDWVKFYRQFLASRVAVMLALARFAWKAKVVGGQTQVDAIKGVYNDKQPAAGSTSVENMSADMQPIKTDSGARNAYEDGRMIKLQVSAGTGWPEQYFGDISIGNLATAKTVELPVAKMCHSHQSVWEGTFKAINDLILQNGGVTTDPFVDIDFPAIAQDDEAAIANSIESMVRAFPAFSDLHDVQTAALLNLGVDNVEEVLTQLDKLVAERKAEAEKIAKAGPIVPTNGQKPGAKPPVTPVKESEEDASSKLLQALKDFRKLLE